MKLGMKNKKVVKECKAKAMSLRAEGEAIPKQSPEMSLRAPLPLSLRASLPLIATPYLIRGKQSPRSNSHLTLRYFLPLLFFIFLNSHFFILHSPFSIQLPALSEGFGTTIDGTGRNITIDGSSCTNCCGFKITSANMIKVL